MADVAAVDALLDRGGDRPHRFLGEQDHRRIVDFRARIGERVEHVVRQHFEMAEALLRLDQLAAIVAGVAGEFAEAGLHPVDTGLDEAGRMGDAFGLAVDHADDLGHFLDRVADLAEAGLGGAAALDAGLDLGGDGACLAGQLADGRGDLAGRGARVVRQLLHFGGNDREAAAGVAGARRLDGRVERQHVGLAGDRLDRRGNGLDLVHRRRRSRPSARPAGRPVRSAP